MARYIQVDAKENFESYISDAEYAAVDWGSSSDDFVRFSTVEGHEVILNLSKVATISITTNPPPLPGTDPAWRIHITSEYGQVDEHINQDTKDAIHAALQLPGAADSILEFTTLEGVDHKVPTANAQHIMMEPKPFSPPGP
jgi:hypothetical protein